MKRSLLALTWVALTISFHTSIAQSAPQTVIGTSGDFATFANGSMSWTIGEVITETYAPTGYFLTQGFHQPDTTYLTFVPNQASADISVYPNPVVEYLAVEFPLTHGKYIVEIYDMQGNLLRKESIRDQQSKLNLSFREFANGIYLLNISDIASNTRSSYKISKAQ